MADQILYCLKFPNYDVCFIFVISKYPGEMPPYAAFHLGLRTVDSEISAKILFSRIALKDI